MPWIFLSVFPFLDSLPIGNPITFGLYRIRRRLYNQFHAARWNLNPDFCGQVKGKFRYTVEVSDLSGGSLGLPSGQVVAEGTLAVR